MASKINSDIQQIEKLADTTYELMDAYRTGLSWLLAYCERNNYPYPDLDHALSLIQISGSYLDAHQPKGNTDNLPTRKQNLCQGAVPS